MAWDGKGAGTGSVEVDLEGAGCRSVGSGNSEGIGGEPEDEGLSRLEVKRSERSIWDNDGE